MGQPKQLFYIGDGENVLPTIHVKDLASIVMHVVAHPPEDQYILGVDESNNTQKEIIEVSAHWSEPRKIFSNASQAISKTLGTGEVKSIHKEEAYLIEDFKQGDLGIIAFSFLDFFLKLADMFQVNVRTESVLLKELGATLKYEVHMTTDAATKAPN